MFFGSRFSHSHKRKLSGLGLLVMSIIKDREDGITGYDIIQEINKEFKHWNVSAGTLYPLLKSLAEKELVSVNKVMEGNRRKKLYYITENGRAKLEKVIEQRMQTSFDHIGDFINAIKKSFPGLSCFPISDMPVYCSYIPEHHKASCDLKHKQITIEKYTRVKETLENQLKEVNVQLTKLKSQVKEIKAEREKIMKPIEIIDDDEEFEKF